MSEKIPEPTPIEAIVMLALMPATILVDGWALGVLWRQNATPLGAWTLSNWDATGLVALGLAIRLAFQRNRKNEFTSAEVIGMGFGEMLTMAMLVALSSWVT